MCLALCRTWRESLEHLRYTFVQALFIICGLIGQSVLGTSAPDQLFGIGVVQVDNQGSYFVVVFGGGGITEPTSESSPSPSSTKAVIERLKSSLRLRRLNRNDGHIAAALHLGQALGCQLGIHGILDSGVPQGIRWLDFLPRIGLVLRESCLVIKVGL